MATAQKAILIGEDLQPLNALQQAQKEVFRRIEAAKHAYDALNVGAFDNNVYIAIISGREGEIRQRYIEEARQAVERLNIPNPQIKKNMLAGTGELFSTFSDACHSLKQCTYNPTPISGFQPFPLEVVTITEEAKPIITEEAKAQFIENHCRSYVATEQEHKAYEVFKQMEKACNSFHTMLKSAGVPVNIYNFNQLNQLLYKSEDGTVTFKADTVKWLAGRLT